MSGTRCCASCLVVFTLVGWQLVLPTTAAAHAGGHSQNGGMMLALGIVWLLAMIGLAITIGVLLVRNSRRSDRAERVTSAPPNPRSGR